MFLVSSLSMASAETLREAITDSVLRNPEVMSKWHLFQASGEAVTAAEGGYYPRVDLEAFVGQESNSTPSLGDRDYTHPGLSLQLRQLLFDGFATRNEVRRVSRERLARYYDLLAASNDVAVETTRAYVDVLRYRELERLARENYAAHRELLELLEQKVAVGLGRRVDLDQALGRLSLAEANWLTETGNLHDVSARYERLVGHQPDATLPPLPKAARPESNGPALMERAVGKNPGYLARIAEIHAAQSELAVRKAPRWPTVELRVFDRLDENVDGIDGSYDNKGIQLAMNYNLYRGGSDRARERESQKRVETAQDLRSKACRDLRQTVRIAWAEVRRLQEQVGYLSQHSQAIQRASEAYRLQFDIGQRSLLDMLDTENELFQSRRAVVNAEMDLQTADTRLKAALNELLSAQQVEPLEKDAPPPEWQQDDYRCPTEMPEPMKLDRDAAMAGRQPMRFVPPAPPPRPKPVVPVDSDQDGVVDDKDACPNTSRGVVVDPRGCPVTQQVRKQIDISSQGLFATGKAELLTTAPLEELATKLGTLSAVDIVLITGHTDQTGQAVKNLALSLARANSVKAYLVSKGIPAERIRTEGRGALEPIVPISQCTTSVKKKLKSGKTVMRQQSMKGAALGQCLQPNRRIVVQVLGANVSAEEIKKDVAP